MWVGRDAHTDGVGEVTEVHNPKGKVVLTTVRVWILVVAATHAHARADATIVVAHVKVGAVAVVSVVGLWELKVEAHLRAVVEAEPQLEIGVVAMPISASLSKPNPSLRSVWWSGQWWCPWRAGGRGGRRGGVLAASGEPRSALARWWAAAAKWSHALARFQAFQASADAAMSEVLRRGREKGRGGTCCDFDLKSEDEYRSIY